MTNEVRWTDELNHWLGNYLMGNLKKKKKENVNIYKIKDMVSNCQVANQTKCEYCKRNNTCQEYQIVKKEKENDLHL